MGKEKKRVESITPRDEDFGRWYTDVVIQAALVDYSSVKGCLILRPNGWGIWERIQHVLDGMLKATGHQNVAMPMFIPESLLEREKDHVEGFAPEVAWVTHGGDEELEERLCVRPTSETLFCEHYAKIVQSYRDLPILYNQWVSVVRWEKSTRPFLRTREFYWQEGHTVHATEEDAMEETLRMLDVYTDFCENYLAMPVIRGQKTDKEKFAGAQKTYTIEAQMHDGKALQSGTSHYFGDGFARAFGIQYSDQNNELQFAHQTSWGVSTRLIGAIIMVHGDDSGLVLPPKIAPTQIALIPIAFHKEGVLDKAMEVKAQLEKDFTVLMDDSDKMPGWKFAQYEMEGIPLRLELGPRDIESGSCMAVRRDTGEKVSLKLENLNAQVQELLDDIQQNLYDRALALRNERIYEVHDYESFVETVENKPGFILAPWCGNQACEDKIKEDTSATSRCIPFDKTLEEGTKCVCCGKEAKHMVYWGKAY